MQERIKALEEQVKEGTV